MKNLLIKLILGISLLSFSAFAIDIGTAKRQLLVGETQSGYLAAVKAPTADTQALINDINTRRKAHYANIAKSNGTSLQAVEQLAGKTAIDKTPKNQYIKIGASWKLK